MAHPRRCLVLAVALSALPLLRLAPIEFVGFDAYWHVFVARQDTWRSFWDEVNRNAHPPVFYLALKAVIAALGSNPIAYRLIPITASLGSTWLVGRLVQRTAGQPWLPAVAAFAFGSSLTTVTIGLDVRAYSLCTFFMLWASLAFVDLVEPAAPAPRRRARVVFALTASLALLTHYVASLFLLSCCVIAAALALVDRARRDRTEPAGRREWRADLLTFGVPLAALATAYAAHMGAWKGHIHHLSAFMFDPRQEEVFEFVRRNTRALFKLLAPAADHRPFASTLVDAAPGLEGWAIDLLVLCSLAAVAWLGFRGARGSRDGEIVRRVPPLLLLTMTALLVVSALLGRYPYGGTLRHQYFLFPFVVVVLTLSIDEIARRTGRRIGALAVGLFALAGLLNATNWMSHFQITQGLLMQSRINRFRELFPAPEVVHVDQFNLIHVFTHHQSWRWRFVTGLRGQREVDVWRVTNPAGTREFYVCRDRKQWLLDFSRHLTYWHLRACLDATGARRAAVFRPQVPRKSPGWPVAKTEELAAGEAPRVGLAAETVEVNGEDLFATFVRR